MTMRTRNRVLRPTDQLDISLADASRMGLREGDRARVSSRQGDAVLPLHIDERMSEGHVFATFSDPATWLNCVIGSRRDPHTGTPEYKVAAVRIDRE